MTVTTVLSFLFITAPGRVLMLAVALGLVALFYRPSRAVLGPLWRLATGGLVFERPGPWDSTWLYAAPLKPAERPNFRGERYPRTAWGRIPGYQRMALRWLFVAYVLVFRAYPTATLLLTATVVVFVVGRRLVREIQDWGLNRAAGLFAAGAAGLLGYGGRDPATWIAVPRLRVVQAPIAVDPRVLRLTRRLPWIGDRLEHVLGALAVPVLRVPLDADNATVRIALDAEITNKNLIADVAELATARLADGPWQAAHQQKELAIVLRHPKRPPAACWYTADANQAYAIDDVPIGQRAGAEWVTLPLKSLTPHTVVSASTGWGKTTIANVYAAHTAGNGGRVLINDPKRIGFIRAFGDLPNVSIRSTVEGWIEHVEAFYAEMQRRYELIEQFPEIADDPELYFQPWFMITDERGSYVSEIKASWKAQGEKGVPEVLRLEKLNRWQSRAAAQYMLDLAQQGNLEVFLDSDGRDQRMARIAAGPQSRSSWMMLFPGTAKIKALMKKGRAVLGLGPDSVEEIQLAQISVDDARTFAAAGAAIAERENAERDKRLAALISTSVQRPGSAASPGATAASVPGQGPDGQYPQIDDENVSVAIPAPRDKSAGESVRPAAGAAGNGTDNDAADELIVGIKAAADYLGMARDAFEKARQRRPIINESRRGALPAWRELDLQEWRQQAPRAGRQAADND